MGRILHLYVHVLYRFCSCRGPWSASTSRHQGTACWLHALVFGSMHKSYRFRANNDPLKVKVSPHGVQEIDSKCTKVKSPNLRHTCCFGLTIVYCMLRWLPSAPNLKQKGGSVIEIEKGDQQNKAPE